MQRPLLPFRYEIVIIQREPQFDRIVLLCVHLVQNERVHRCLHIHIFRSSKFPYYRILAIPEIFCAVAVFHAFSSYFPYDLSQKKAEAAPKTQKHIHLHSPFTCHTVLSGHSFKLLRWFQRCRIIVWKPFPNLFQYFSWHEVFVSTLVSDNIGFGIYLLRMMPRT